MGVFDLITLAQLKASAPGVKGISDAALNNYISAVSSNILGMIGRSGILPASYTQISDGSPAGILLRERPVISVESVSDIAFGAPRVLPAANTFLAPVSSSADAYTMLRAPGLSMGTDNAVITYTAGYQNSETVKVPAGGGNVTLTQPLGAWGSDRGVTGLSGPYSAAAGVYTFDAADAGKTVTVRYGYVPADLTNAASEWIADRLAYQERVGYKSKSLGGQETISFAVVDTPDYVKSILKMYTSRLPIC